MPTRKQRRRRDKQFRHEYDLVTYDEEGNEVPFSPAESSTARGKDATKGKTTQKRGSGGGRPVREVPPPSWERALKRGGFMGAALVVIMVVFLRGPLPLAVAYGAALIPFTYWVDRVSYRRFMRRAGKS